MSLLKLEAGHLIIVATELRIDINPWVVSEFPAGILQDKFFDASYPKYKNYAAIGSIVAHEITHGFDDVGRQFDLNGNLAEWWNNDTLNQYLAKAQCIIDQYSNYTDPQTKLQVSSHYANLSLSRL